MLLRGTCFPLIYFQVFNLILLQTLKQIYVYLFQREIMLTEPGCGGFASLHLSLLQAINVVLSSEGSELNDSNTKE